MASIETRKNRVTKNPKGISYKAVRYDQDGRKKSKTWPTRDRAELWKALIESVNGDENAAAQHLARQASTAPTVREVAQHRLGLIRRTEFTAQTYESYMKNHIGPAFGDLPVDAITEDDCRRFVIGTQPTVYDLGGISRYA